MLAAACNDPDAVLQSFVRILAQGQLTFVRDPVHSSTALVLLLCPCGRECGSMPLTEACAEQAVRSRGE